MSLFGGADLYLHHKHGVNFWGYRGPSLGRKQPGEKRVAVLGGSTTWGFGLKAGQDFPAQLQQLLSKNGGAINVVNLGSNNEGAYSFTQTMADYDYLSPDLLIFYSGYNDLSEPNLYNFRHRSPIFGATGYLPLLPALTVDKLNEWKRRLLNQNDKIIFTPPRAEEQNSTNVGEKLDALNKTNAESNDGSSSLCSPQNQFYCERIRLATTAALAAGKRVLVVGEPYIADRHIAQQRDLARMLSAQFSGDRRVKYLDLGRVVDLRDPALCWDGMHLTEEGNRRIAQALWGPTLEMLQQ